MNQLSLAISETMFFQKKLSLKMVAAKVNFLPLKLLHISEHSDQSFRDNPIAHFPPVSA
ncbi:hypothetical protein VCRA217O17_910001 [Vibrio crassostreae]|nr:hypothetical protein VCRA217O17_910001 [Vibrio crassostreae]